MDEDVASAATALFGSGPNGLLTIDHREILGSTARVVGTELGEVHLKVFMALVTLHVMHGMPDDGRSYTTVAELGSIIWGSSSSKGGKETKQLINALNDLRAARFTLPGVDVSDRPAPGVSDVNLLNRLYLDETLLRAYEAPGATGLTGAEFGRAFGGSRNTIGWRLDDLYVERLNGAELRRFDWVKAQQLRGAALKLWMVFSSPRIPFRSVFGGASGMHSVELPLTVENCAALGVRNAQSAGRRRTINQAGERICAADRSFVSFEAHGGRSQEDFLRVVRHRQDDDVLVQPYAEGSSQLTLEAAS